MRHRFAGILLGVTLATAPGVLLAQGTPGPFDHLKHARLFPSCTVCHAGAEDPDSSMWPDSTACATCHDGSVQPRVSWHPPEAETPSNLKFVHDLVPIMTRETPQGTEELTDRKSVV